MTQDPPLEIERVFVLSHMPELPPEAAAKELEQGYLPEEDGADYAEGRVRRARRADGRVRCTHTVKRGAGMVRQEEEREIDETTFERLWERTEGRRIRKVRFAVPAGERTWEVDRFEGLDLVLAEVELPSADTEVSFPPWLAPCVVAEVTDDPRYRNYALARHGVPQD